MKIARIELTNFRNICQAELEPEDGLTVIFGKNGQGKTNLLEAIWLLTGAKSFRGAKDAELIQRKQQFSIIRAEIETQDMEKEIQISICPPGSPKPGRTAKVSGVDQGRASNLAGLFRAVVFEPNHLSLVKGSPEGRRKFVDSALCQLYPGYLAEYRRYLQVLSQKNALLKHYRRTPGAAEMLDIYDEQMAQAAQKITQRRQDYIATLAPLATQNYANISHGAEKLEIAYIPTAPQGNLQEILRNNRKEDLRCGFCTVGPHREDISIFINGQSARTDASQGQQRSAVLSLKLAEATMIEQITQEHPVMLLDDVLSELDEGRQQYLLSRMEGKQIFVSGCDGTMFRKTKGKMFHMEQGTLKPWKKGELDVSSSGAAYSD